MSSPPRFNPKHSSIAHGSWGAAGWLARWRALRGVSHPPGRVSIGYQAWNAQVSLSRKELNHHGVIFGAPGKGKTTTIALLAQGHARFGPTIILDGKGSLTLQAAILAAGGLVWTIGGPRKLDLLDPDPTILAEQLTEATRHDGPAEVYTESAARAIQWAGHILRWRGVTPTLDAIEELLLPGKLAQALQQYAGRERVALWLAELNDIGDVELSGMQTALMRITRLLDSAAGPSLGAGVDAIRLEDAVQGKNTLLLSFDSRRYPGLSRILGGWSLIALQRACAAVPPKTSCLMIVDEVSAFGKQARHLEPLLARARDAGVGVALAAHGPRQLEDAHHGLANMVLQETAWAIILGQGDPDDADQLSRLFPLDESRPITLGRYAQGTPSVTRDHLMWQARGDCAYRVLPVDGIRGRWGRARIAMPRVVELPGADLVEDDDELVVGDPGAAAEEAETAAEEATATLTGGKRESAEADGPLPEADRKELVYRHVKVIKGWRVWRGSFDHDGYPRVWIPNSTWNSRKRAWVGGWHQAHRLVCGWEHGPIPKGWTVDHVCGLLDCMSHLEAVTRAENTRRKHERERGERPTGHPQPAQQAVDELPSDAAEIQPKIGNSVAEQFAIALFAGVDRPAVEQKSVSLDELRQLLSRFEVLADKRRGRCWSPTRYAEDASSRGNAGVLEVSALVFDMDKVPPDPERLDGVYWLGHTTWSHTPQAPRWRVVVPLATPVPAAQWRNVWQHARTALCPEADPSCKDQGRQYWLPSHSGGVTAKATCHEGPLLDVATLPALPSEPKRPKRSPTAQILRAAEDRDHRRGEAYMGGVIANLEATASGGRNVALNGAAWTLGRWVGAGALEQGLAEDALYAAAERNGLVADDGARACWATIRSGLSAGLQDPKDLDEDER